MISCPLCRGRIKKRNGRIRIERMTKDGLKTEAYQRYLCVNNHSFSNNPKRGSYNDSFIELVVMVYLRSLSLNTTIDLLRIFYERNILTKSLILSFIENVSDKLPTLDDIDNLFHPQLNF